MRILLFFALSCAFPCFAQSSTTLVEMVVASIDGEPVTTSDVRRFAVVSGQNEAIDLHSGDKEIRKLLRELIIDRLLAREAEKLGIAVDEDAVALYLEEVKRQNGVDDRGFQAILDSRGIALDDYKRQVRSDILRTRVIGSQVRAKVQISEEDIQRHLIENPAEEPAEGTVYLEQIFIPFEITDEDSAVEDKLQKLQETPSAWKKDEHYSNLGYIDPGDLLSELGEIAQGLEPAEVSEIVRTNKGAYLLRRSVPHSGESREEIKNELMQAEVAERLQHYLNEELPKKYHVEILL